MRQLKVIALSLLVLSLLVLGFSFLIPSHSRVSRAINIRKPRQQIKMELAQLQHWVQWHPFLKKQPPGKSIQYGTDNRQIQIDNYSFTINAETDSTIQFTAVNPAGEKMNSTIAIYNYGDSSAVNWYSEVKVKWYPWEKFKTIFYDNMYGPTLDSNLVALKKYLENN